MIATLDRLAASRAGMPVRRTARLVLRPWQEADREAFAALNADPEVMAHLPAPLTRAESDAFLDRMRVSAARAGFGRFAVEDRATKALVGMVGLDVPPWEAPFTPAVEIGWRIGRAWWGQGLAEEAARDVLAWAFTTLRLPRVVSFTAPANTRSWGLMERLGMGRVGLFEHPGLPEGHPLRPHVLYALDAPVVVSASVSGGARIVGSASSHVPAAAPAPVVPPIAAPPPAPLPRVWIDGDGAPRVVKEIVWKAAERGVCTALIVANRPLVVPKHRNIQTVVVKHGLDVADDWLVAHAGPGDLVITSDIPLAAELVPLGVEVMSPRGEWFTPSNIGEKLSMRDFFTEARASGMIEGSGPAAFDEKAKRGFANGLDQWLGRARR